MVVRDVADATAVELVTVFIKKRRFSRIGIVLAHDGHPVVLQSTDYRFSVGDTIYMINGHVAIGARSTAWRIWRKSHLSITLWTAS